MEKQELINALSAVPQIFVRLGECSDEENGIKCTFSFGGKSRNAVLKIEKDFKPDTPDYTRAKFKELREDDVIELIPLD